MGFQSLSNLRLISARENASHENGERAQMLDILLRAYRGAARSPARTLLVVVLLAAVISFALTAVTLAFAAGDELDKIKLTTGVEASVTVNPQQFQRAIEEELARAQEQGEEF